MQILSYKLRVLILFSIGIFLASSILTAYYTREICTFNSTPSECHLYRITLIRVAVEGVLFLLFGFLLCSFLLKLAKISINNSIPEQNVIILSLKILNNIFF